MPDVFVSETKKEEEIEGGEPVVDEKQEQVGVEVGKKKIIPDSVLYNPFNSYMYKPRRVHFETKHKDEEVLLLLRKHPITNVPWIITAFIMLLALSVLEVFPILDFLPASLYAILIISWYLITSAFVLENFLVWFFNVSIVTNKRIVDIDFVNLLYKEVSDAELRKVEDVTYKMGGAIRTVFNYGDVIIQTASEVPNFDFLAVPRPDEVVKVLQKLREENN